MMIDRNKINELADKWMKGTITEEEKQYFEDWYNREAEQHPEWTRDLDEQSLRNRLFRSILEKTESKKQDVGKIISKPRRKKQRYKWYSAAAAVVIFTIGIWLFQYHDPSYHAENKQSNARIDLPPGREAATLTLADGSLIDLDATQNGEVTIQGKTIVSKQGGQVAYIPPIGKEMLPVLYNTINTARGNLYQLVLS